MNLDLDSVLLQMAQKRPIFHNEADFKHAFAWAIQRTYPAISIRLEYSPRPQKAEYIDIWLRGPMNVAIELKYHKGEFVTEIDGEVFSDPGTAPKDATRHGFLKDVARLENLISKIPNTSGVAILITNENMLWDRKDRPLTDTNFHIHNDRKVHGTLKWAPRTSEKTKRAYKAVTLLGEYTLRWRDYSNIVGAKKPRFRYLRVAVSPP